MKEYLVADLRTYLKTTGTSPEKFAREVQLSHMTIRRWLRKPDETAIPKKYYGLLKPLLQGASNSPNDAELDLDSQAQSSITEKLRSLDMAGVMEEIEKSGQDFQDFQTLNQDLKSKLKTGSFDELFVGFCKSLFEAAKNPISTPSIRAVAIGALLYFINPIDLIPDHIPGIGYLDDLAVLSVAVNYITGAAILGRSDKNQA